jgi:hypothetical protein
MVNNVSTTLYRVLNRNPTEAGIASRRMSWGMGAVVRSLPDADGDDASDARLLGIVSLKRGLLGRPSKRPYIQGILEAVKEVSLLQIGHRAQNGRKLSEDPQPNLPARVGRRSSPRVPATRQTRAGIPRPAGRNPSPMAATAVISA